ncbi:MAG: 50S ribosomal protein L11 methyltransferase [Oscillospiraceae bacterium]|nr:50S ribosomal protein L11 methyltransferase [Oscillospiraceae bacterium]
MNWTKINVYTTTEGIEPVCGRLLGIGVTGFEIEDSAVFEEFLADKSANWDYIDDDLMNLKNCETRVICYLPDNAQGADMLSALKQELSELKKLDTEGTMGRLEFSPVNVAEEDWANNWKQYFKPLKVGEKLLIKPSWEKCDDIGDRRVLEIDPASSFGTGQHDTTKLCLELLEKHIHGGERVLDLGCGSGILSIGAMLLGADSVCAVDIEENSVKTAAENAQKNGIDSADYTVYAGDIITNDALREKIGNGYKIITANIVADVIIAMSGRFGEFLTRDGVVIISGIIKERSAEVIAAMEDKGFNLIEFRESSGWSAAVMSY